MIDKKITKKAIEVLVDSLELLAIKIERITERLNSIVINSTPGHASTHDYSQDTMLLVVGDSIRAGQPCALSPEDGFLRPLDASDSKVMNFFPQFISTQNLNTGEMVCFHGKLSDLKSPTSLGLLDLVQL